MKGKYCKLYQSLLGIITAVSQNDWLVISFIYWLQKNSSSLLHTQDYVRNYLLVIRWAWYFIESSTIEAGTGYCGNKCKELSSWLNIWVEFWMIVRSIPFSCFSQSSNIFSDHSKLFYLKMNLMLLFELKLFLLVSWQIPNMFYGSYDSSWFSCTQKYGFIS